MLPAFDGAVVEIDVAFGQREVGMAALVVDSEPTVVAPHDGQTMTTHVESSGFAYREIILVADNDWRWTGCGFGTHTATTSRSDPLPSFFAIAARSDGSVVVIGRSAITSSKKPATMS